MSLLCPCFSGTFYPTFAAATDSFSDKEFLSTSATDDFRQVEVEGKWGSVKSPQAISESALRGTLVAVNGDGAPHLTVAAD